jgi:hypothetical protein
MQIRSFCTTGDIYDNNLQGGTQFKDSTDILQVKHFDFLNKKNEHRCNTVLQSKTCFVIARRFFLSVSDITACDALSLFTVITVVYLAAALDYEMPADRERNHGTQRLRLIQQQLCSKVLLECTQCSVVYDAIP